MILVTGGAGMIGSALIWALNQQGRDDILVVDILNSSDKRRNLAPLRIRDYIEAEDLDLSKLKEVSVLFHFGAITSTFETDLSALLRVNFGLSKRLFEWARERGVKFIYASSAATYGARGDAISEREDLDSLRPLNAYGHSKHLFDLYLKAIGCLEKVVGLKYFNIFGPNEWHKTDMVSGVFRMYHQIESSGKVVLLKSYRPEIPDGEQCRDFLYLKDAVAMTLHLAQRGSGGLYNIGSGRSTTWSELALAVFRALGREPKICFQDMPEAMRSTYQYSTRANIEKLRASGYDKPITPPEAAVNNYVQNYLVPRKRLGEESTDFVHVKGTSLT